MFEMGGGELLLLFIIALLVLGPQRLPKVAAELGKWVGRARRTATQLRRQLEHEVELNEIIQPPKPPPARPTPPPTDSPAAGDAPVAQEAPPAIPDPWPPAPDAPPAAADPAAAPAPSAEPPRQEPATHESHEPTPRP